MNARRGAARSGAAAARTLHRRRAGSAALLAGVTLLMLLVFPLVAGAESEGLEQQVPDLTPTGSPTLVPSPDTPLKIGEVVTDVVNGITEPSQPPPTGGGGAGEEPDPGGRDGRGGGGGAEPRSGGRTSLPPISDATAGLTAGNAAGDEALVPAFGEDGVWRAVSPGLGTLATRARSLVAPLAAPMGLGVVAVMLLGLASRGPGVISKLNEELESADGRQVWRL